MLAHLKNNSIDKYPIALVSIVYFLASLYLYNTYGVKVVNDSHRYLEYASGLREGFYFDKHNFWYFGYVFFIYLVNSFYDGIFAIIIAQYILSYLSIIALYRCYYVLHPDKTGALLVAISYILFIDVLSWNSYILCESVYSSLICISLYLLINFYKKKIGQKWIFLVVPVVILTCLTKPTGVAMTVAITITIIIALIRYNDNLKTRIIATIICIIPLVLLINKMLSTYLILENYQLGEIIYGIHTMPHIRQYDWMVIDPPTDLYLPPADHLPLVKVILFILANPLYWCKLFFTKLFYLLFHIRPFWSTTHNIYSLSFLIPIYYFSILGFVKNRIPWEVKSFAFIYVFIHLLSVGMTSVDWDGRFLMPILPLLFIFGTFGLFRSVNYAKTNQISK